MTGVFLGQVGRSLGPLIFCTLYWWAGRETAYSVGGLGMVGVCGLVFAGLRSPRVLEEDEPGGMKAVSNGKGKRSAAAKPKIARDEGIKINGTTRV